MKKTKEISLKLYSKQVIIKAAYDFLDKFNIELFLNEEGNSIIINLPEDQNNKIFWNEFNKKLIDYQLRQIIFDETKDIRNMLFDSALNESLSKKCKNEN